MSPFLVSVCVMTMPGQADHCGVDVKVGAKKSVSVGEGISVTGGVEVNINVGEEAGETVVVGVAGISFETAGVKFDSDPDIPKMHALSMNMAVTGKSNVKKYFLIRMVASILNKKTQDKPPA